MARRSGSRRTPHPLGCFTEAVRLPRQIEDYEFSRTFIRATADAPDAPGGHVIAKAGYHAKSSPRWRYHEIASNHMVPSNRPKELAALLLDLAD